MANNYEKGKHYKAMATEIKAEEKMLIDNEKAMLKVRLNFQSRCMHRDDNGAFALIAPNGGSTKSRWTKSPLYTCRLCKKQLDISNVNQEEFEEALNTINRVLDLSKMHLNLNSDKDKELLAKLGKMQFKMNTILPDVYQVIRKGGRKKKNNNENRNNSMVEVIRPR